MSSAVIRYESDLLGLTRASGAKLANQSFVAASADRYSQDIVTYAYDAADGAWWEKSTHRNFIEATGSFVDTVSARRLKEDTGEVSRTTDAAGQLTVVSRSYDPSDPENPTVTVTIQDPRAGTSTETQVNGYLRTRSVPDSNSDAVFEYDGFGRQVASTDVRGARSVTAYNGLGQIESGTDPLNRKTSYFYYPKTHASAGMLHKVVNADGIETIYTYDAEGRVVDISGSATYRITYGYDAWGALHTMTTYGTVTATTTWDRDPATGLLTGKRYAGQAAGEGVRYSYTADGRLGSRTWSRGNKAAYAYNGWGDLTGIDYKQADGSSPDSATPDVDFSNFDRLGRYKTVDEHRASGTDTTSLAYHPVTGAASSSYAATHRLLPAVDLARTAPDSLGRPTGFTVSQNGGAIQTESYGYDAVSRLSTIGAAGDRLSYSYYPGTAIVRQATHELAGTDIRQEARNIDLAGGLVGVVTRTPSAGGLAIAFSSGYLLDGLGRRTVARREDGSSWQYAYNDRSEVVGGRKVLPDGSLAPGMQFGYGYDGIGNRDWTQSGGGADGAGFRTTDYTPDALNQYDSITHPGTFDVLARSDAAVDFTAAGATSVASASNGNFHRAEVTADNSGGGRWLTVEAESPPGSETIVEGDRWLPPANQEPQHDADGNLLADGRWSYTWDGENRLIGMEVTAAAEAGGHPYVKLSFHYDWLGRRIGKTVFGGSSGNPTFGSSTRWLYDGWNPVAEFSAAADTGGAITRSADYRWGLDLSGSLQGAGGVGGLLEIIRQNGTGSPDRYFPAYDGNGNVIGWTNAAGTTLQRLDYDPFGNLLTRECATGHESLRLHFGFSTKYQDAETGLCYYGYRYLDPVTGRWPSRDPIEEAGGINLYGFVRNSGISFVDILGLDGSMPSPTTSTDCGRTGQSRITKETRTKRGSGKAGWKDLISKQKTYKEEMWVCECELECEITKKCGVQDSDYWDERDLQYDEEVVSSYKTWEKAFDSGDWEYASEADARTARGLAAKRAGDLAGKMVDKMNPDDNEVNKTVTKQGVSQGVQHLERETADEAASEWQKERDEKYKKFQERCSNACKSAS